MALRRFGGFFFGALIAGRFILRSFKPGREPVGYLDLKFFWYSRAIWQRDRSPMRAARFLCIRTDQVHVARRGGTRRGIISPECRSCRAGLPGVHCDAGASPTKAPRGHGPGDAFGAAPPELNSEFDAGLFGGHQLAGWAAPWPDDGDFVSKHESEDARLMADQTRLQFCKKNFGARFTRYVAAFSWIGLDYDGGRLLRGSKRRLKIWGASKPFSRISRATGFPFLCGRGAQR